MVMQKFFVSIVTVVLSFASLQATNLQPIQEIFYCSAHEKNGSGNVNNLSKEQELDQFITTLLYAVEICAIPSIKILIKDADSTLLEYLKKNEFFSQTLQMNRGLLGAAIQKVVCGECDKDFFDELLSNLNICNDCGLSVFLDPQTMSEEKFELYSQALASCVEMVQKVQ